MSRLQRGNLRFTLTLAVIFAIVLSAVGAAYIARSIANSHPSLANSDPSDERVFANLLRTPPMGWNGFNRFARTVNARLFKAEAQALVRSGMVAAGYTYINLDGGWDLPFRSPEGYLLPDRRKFPDGIKPLADYVHSLGLKFGIYTSYGTMNCAATSAGSYGHYAQDAAMFASWGVDYIKVDWCYVPYGDFPHLTERQIAVVLTREMGTAIVATGRPMVYYVNYPFAKSWAWSVPAAHVWRTTMDSQDSSRSLFDNFRGNVNSYSTAAPGRWNDPDMMEIGNRSLNLAEQRAEFSLWAIMAAPLIAGNDLISMTPPTRTVLTNIAVIAIDQDPLGVQGYPVASSGGLWVLTKPLANGDRVVVFFNSTTKPATISTTAAKIGLARASGYALINLWTGLTTRTVESIKALVQPQSVVMYDVGAI